MLTGNKAPSAANLEQWLKDHPGYEVVRSAGKIVTTKVRNSMLTGGNQFCATVPNYNLFIMCIEELVTYLER